MMYPLSATIVQTGHSASRDNSPPASSRDVTRNIEVNSTDPIVPMSGRVKAAAAMASTATETTASHYNAIEMPRLSFDWHIYI